MIPEYLKVPCEHCKGLREIEETSRIFKGERLLCVSKHKEQCWECRGFGFSLDTRAALKYMGWDIRPKPEYTDLSGFTGDRAEEVRKAVLSR